MKELADNLSGRSAARAVETRVMVRPKKVAVERIVDSGCGSSGPETDHRQSRGGKYCRKSLTA